MKYNWFVLRFGHHKITHMTTKKLFEQEIIKEGRPGYVVDHIVPLKRGGCDCPANMQWQTIKAAKEKDKWE